MEKSTLTPLGVKQSSQRPEPQERQAKQLGKVRISGEILLG